MNPGESMKWAPVWEAEFAENAVLSNEDASF
jgi:hypothetical protein